jgi:biopolymer transport protein TolR
MAMNTNENDALIGSINITPLVDILLVLLVIFMVTANFLKKESININLPKVAAADPNVAQSMQIALTKDGKLFLEGVETNEEKLRNTLINEVKYRPNKRVTLSADDGLPYRSIMHVMGLIRQTSVTKIALSAKK